MCGGWARESGSEFLCRLLNNKYNLGWGIFLAGWGEWLGGGGYKLGLNGKDAQDLETFRFSSSNKNVEKREKAESLLIKMRRYPYNIAFFNYRYF